MKTTRIAICDWLEIEFSVPVVKAMSQRRKERRFIVDGKRVNNLFAHKAIAETNTTMFVPAA